MADLTAVHTDKAPAALGPYNQAIRTGDLVFLAGQIGLIPQTMALVEGGIEAQTHQIFRNMQVIAEAAGTHLAKAVKLTIFLHDLNDFPIVNRLMAEYCQEPWPARSTIQASSLPKDAAVEIEAILAL